MGRPTAGKRTFEDEGNAEPLHHEEGLNQTRLQGEDRDTREKRGAGSEKKRRKHVRKMEEMRRGMKSSSGQASERLKNVWGGDNEEEELRKKQRIKGLLDTYFNRE